MTTKLYKQVNLRKFPIDLYERLQKIAERHRRHVSQEILYALDQYVALMEKEVNSEATCQMDKE